VPGPLAAQFTKRRLLIAPSICRKAIGPKQYLALRAFAFRLSVLFLDPLPLLAKSTGRQVDA